MSSKLRKNTRFRAHQHLREAPMALTVVDLFCGAGGLSLGLRNAAFTPIAAFDNWMPAVETYRRNLGGHVSQVAIDDDMRLPSSDVIVGGPPCQGFSSAGARRFGDGRNSLVGVFARLVARHLPRAFLFENVEGFLTGGDGAFVLELLEPLVDAGYQIHVRKVNAANFGVPQHRKRVIVIGGLGWAPSFPAATHFAFGAPGAIRSASSTLPRTPNVDDALRDLALAQGAIADHTPATLNLTDLQRARALRPGQTMRDLPEELWHDSYRRRANRRVRDGTPTERRGGAPAGIRRLHGDQPAKAITGAASREFLHPHEHRPLTIRECATLQTFPLTFEFVGTSIERMRMIGNGVPVRLATALGSSLFADLLRGDWQISVGSQGKILSFMPSVSEGMSPALANVTERVYERFMPSRKIGVSGDLWA
jgi:DNA (cytosine-5)-methyltransferase 1